MVNWLGVALCVLAVFAVGGPWYGPIFGKAWMRASGLSEEMKGPHKGVVFGGAAIAGLIAAIALNLLIGPHPSLLHAVTIGGVAGSGLVATSFVINYLFAARSMVLLAIDGAYNIVLFTLMGGIFGVLG